MSRARQIGTQALGGERLLGATGLDSSGTYAEAAMSQILASFCPSLFGVLLVNTSRHHPWAAPWAGSTGSMRFHSRVITRDAVLNGPSCRTVTVHRCRSDRPRDASYRYFMPHVISQVA